MRSVKKAILLLLTVFMIAGLSATASAAAGSVKKTSIAKAKVTGTTIKYTGKMQAPKNIKVKVGKVTLKKGVDYKITIKQHKRSGSYSFTIKGIGHYQGTLKKTYTIKGTNNQKIEVKTKNNAKTTYKASAFKKAGKKITLSVKKVKVKGTISYKVTKGSSKYITVSKKGVVTLKKGIKAGTYKVAVMVSGKGSYNPTSKTVTFKVK